MDKLVIEYFEQIPAPRKPALNSLHALIMGAFPAATVEIKYKMPTYCHGDGWVAIANQKNYVSLYTCGTDHIKEFTKKHPEIKTGKGCINFKEKDILPLGELRKVIEHAFLQPKGE